MVAPGKLLVLRIIVVGWGDYEEEMALRIELRCRKLGHYSKD